MNSLPLEQIQRRIYFIRDQKVMVDRDLAELYGVSTGHLNRAVKRNPIRFPEDFMFQLTQEEYQALRCQIGILEKEPHPRYLPYVFTREGVSMLSGILHSKRAALVNVQIMRAFVRLSDLLATHKDLARKLEEMEKRYDAKFKVVFDAIRRLMKPAPRPKLPPLPQVKGFGKD